MQKSVSVFFWAASVVICLLLAMSVSIADAQEASAPVAVEAVAVEDAALGPYRQAIDDSLRYFEATHAVSLTQPVILRVYGTTELFVPGLAKYFPSEIAAQATAEWSFGWAGHQEILVNHSRLREPFRQYEAVAHELTHQLQIELAGFDRMYSDRAWKSCWLAEGHASLTGWKVGDGRVTSYPRARASALDQIRKAPGFSLKQAKGGCAEFRPLQTQVSVGAAYGMSMLAAETLVEQHGFAAVVAYFRNLASQSAEEAFQSAFHVSMNDFLTDFDARLAQAL